MQKSFSMRKTPRKLELKTQTVIELTTKELEIVIGGGRSRTGDCPVIGIPPNPKE